MTHYESTLPDEVKADFDFVALKLTGKTIAGLNCIVTRPPYNYPSHVLPLGVACQFDAVNIGMSVLLEAAAGWDGKGWVQMMYLRPIGYDYAPWRFGSGTSSIGRDDWIDNCIASATRLYQKPEYRAEWLKNLTYK